MRRAATASGPRDPAASLPLTGSVVLLASIGTLAVAQAPAFDRTFAWVFALVAGLRLAGGRDGRRLLPRRILHAVGFSLAATSLAYVLLRLSGRTPVEGPNALWALMEITCLFEALVLLWRQRAFSSFLVILFSSVHATGIAFAVPETSGLFFVGAYVIVLAWTLVVFERGAALELEPDDEGAVVRVRADGRSPLPWPTALRTTAVLLLFGLPLGALVYLAAPRNWELPGNLGAKASKERVGHAAGLDLLTEEERWEAEGYIIGRTGPGEGGVPLGSIAEIKRDLTPYFEVTLRDGEAWPPTVILREKVQDTYFQVGTWKGTLGQSGRSRIHRDFDDGKPDGWIPLEHDETEGERTTLRVKLLRGGNRTLFHQPWEAGVTIRRDGRILPPAEVRETGDERLRARVPLKEGDVVLQRYVAPPDRDDPRLLGRRSDSRVAPQAVYLQIPPGVRPSMLRHARRAVGDETDPWRRALRIERWLKSDDFTYTLAIPPLDRRNPIVDFLDRTRSGHCELFAIAQTLMLRALGHPARYASGFWGGDRLEESRTVLVRGTHFHGWCEMYLDGVGWMALNPTPPERRAADAGSITMAGESATPRAEEDWSFDVLGMDEAAWRGFWRRVGRAADDHVLSPVGALFERRTGYAGVWISLLLLLCVHRTRRTARARRLVVGPGKALPAGAYGKALMLLARKGVRRPGAWTVTEFARHVARRFPAAATPFAALSRAHEQRIYGGEAIDDHAAAAHLEAVRRGLRPRSERS